MPEESKGIAAAVDEERSREAERIGTYDTVDSAVGAGSVPVAAASRPAAVSSPLATEETSHGIAGLGPPPALAARFEVLGEIGRGAMGVVLEVRHRELDKVMAAKVMSGNAFSKQAFLRFRREARAASDIAHPAILRVHDLDRAPDGSPFIVMERLRGRPLDEVLQTDGPLPLARVIALMTPVAEALDRAHGLGIVHRDLKPANLFLTDDGVVKILDFGVCHYDIGDGGLTRAGELMGTPLYMPPEQLRGETPSPQTDVYALSAILYQMLVGTPPFKGYRFHELMTRPESDRPPRVETIDATIPAGVGDALARGLSHRAERRYPSAGALLEALAAARDASIGPARPQRPRWPLYAVSGAAVVFAVAAALTFGVFAPAVAPPGDAPAGAPDSDAIPTLGDRPALAGGPAASSAPGASVPRAPAAPAVAAPWPASVRLVVLPLRSAPERDLDADLWPLADRFVVNALDVDERVLGRLERVDPGVVEEIALRRQLGPTIDGDEGLEVAALVRANVLLDGEVVREGGLLHLRGTLRAVPDGRSAPIDASGAQLSALARATADAIRVALWGDAPPAVPAGRAGELLLGRDESVARLATVDGLTPRGEWEQTLRAIQASDEGAIGVAWQLLLPKPDDAGLREDLAAFAGKTDDPQLRAFLAAVAPGGRGRDACADFDPAALGARYPLVLGPLAPAVCDYLRGDWSEAERQAQLAFADLRIRPLARPVLRRALALAKTCDEQIPTLERMQRLMPEQVLGWSELAVWNARCERMDEARHVLGIARALLGDDRLVNYVAATHGASIHLVDLDLDGARDWLDVLEANRDPAAPRHLYYFMSSLAFQMQGRPRQALERLREGRRALREAGGDLYSMVAAAEFYGSLALGEVDRAGRVVEEFERVFEDPKDVGNRYMAGMLRLALDRARDLVPPEALDDRMRELSHGLVRALGDLGRDERDTQECMLVSQLGTAEQATRILGRAAPTNKALGGCRYRDGARLLAEGRIPEAADQLRRAIGEILWGRFLYIDLIAPALLDHARALEGLGDRDGARAAYDRILKNYARAEGVMPEVLAARDAVTRLAAAAPGAPQ